MAEKLSVRLWYRMQGNLHNISVECCVPLSHAQGPDQNLFRGILKRLHTFLITIISVGGWRTVISTMKAILSSILSLGIAFLLLFGCGPSQSKLIESGPLAGLPQAGKDVSDSSGIWKVQYFSNSFKETTEQPFIRTCFVPFVCNDMDNKPQKSNCESVIMQIYIKNSHPQVSISGRYLPSCFHTNVPIPVRFKTEDGESTIFNIDPRTISIESNYLLFDEFASFEMIKTLLNANGPVSVQLKLDKGFYAWQKNEAIYSYVLEPEGFQEVYNQFVKSELKWEAKCDK